MTTVTLSKKEQIAAAKQAFVTGGLVQVQGVAPLEVFVKQLNSAEFRSIKATAESFKGKYDDGLNDERELSLELFDADGQLYFDHADVAEMQFLANLPVGIKRLLSDAAQDVVWGEYLQKKAMMAKPEKTS